MRKIENSKLMDVVYNRIKSMILEGSLVPGSKIVKKDLAKALGVSLTPINEAVSKLVGEKLIQPRARQGFYIRTYTDLELADLFAVRAGLESTAIRICIEEGSKADLERLSSFFLNVQSWAKSDFLKKYTEEDIAFHQAIMETAGISLLKEINSSFGYILKTYEHGLVRPPEETLQEHLAIVEAIKNGNATKAAEILSTHHLCSRRRLMGKVRTTAATTP